VNLKQTIIYTFCLLAGTFTQAAPVLVITHAYLRPDFIEIQDKTFKKFLKDDYEFIVFNDARNQSLRKEITAICNKLNLRCIEIPQAIHDRPYLKRFPHEDRNNACARCANVVQYSLNELGFKYNGLVAIIDSDMFLIKDFSIANFMANHDIAGIPQSRGNIHYLWNGIVFFNMNTLPDKETMDFNCGIINGNPVDVGGYTYYYFQKHPEVRKKEINLTYPHNFACAQCLKNCQDFACTHNTEFLKQNNFHDARVIAFIQNGPPNMEFTLDRTFIHYRGGGNWDGQSAEYHRNKTKILLDFINSITN